jgi:hypothetical protein
MNQFGTHNVILIQITEEVEYKQQDNQNTLFSIIFEIFYILGQHFSKFCYFF